MVLNDPNLEKNLMKVWLNITIWSSKLKGKKVVLELYFSTGLPKWAEIMQIWLMCQLDLEMKIKCGKLSLK